MIVSFSDNIFKQIVGVSFFNRWRLIAYFLIAEIAYTLHHTLGMDWILLPVVPVTILGGALAIFLGFRNSSAYDRWWEARKVWGGIVNDSRSFTVFVLEFFTANSGAESEMSEMQKRLVYRHLGWIYILKNQLRKKPVEDYVAKWFNQADQALLANKANVATQILRLQSADLKKAKLNGWINDYEFVEINRMITRFYDEQGKCERIKNTIFPFYYNYFTRLFLWLFMLSLPFALVGMMGWISLPLSIAISFVFGILEKTGIVTENPFEGRAADTPMTSLCRTIEIDLLQMMGEENIPAPIANSYGRFGVVYKS